MKVYLDDEEVFEISESDIKLLSHEIDDVKEDIKRRLEWVINHKCTQIYKELTSEWTQKMIEDPKVKSIPANKEEFIDKIISHPKYKSRAKRFSEEPTEE